MADPLKYAVVERERRLRVASLPEGVVGTSTVVDRYVVDTRLRLREIRREDGDVVRKLGHKARLDERARAVAVTNFSLDDAEWELLSQLPAHVLRKRRHLVERDGYLIAIDEHEDGTMVAQIDDGDGPVRAVPAWLDVLEDVTGDERWTGAGLARAGTAV